MVNLNDFDYSFLEGRKMLGVDLETYDPYLTAHGSEKARGASWVFNKGEVLCIGVYNPECRQSFCIDDKDKMIQFARQVLSDDKYVLIGVNIQYDAGWLMHLAGLTGKPKCHFLDVAFAEFHLSEYSQYSLDFLAKKYLNEGKKKTALEDWALKQGYSGDFRKYLKDAPKDLLADYVMSDADQPVRIWEKQRPLLEADNIIQPFYLDCELIPIIVAMKIAGLKVDTDLKKKTYDEITEVYTEKFEEFKKKYGDVNFNSSKQIAALFDRLDIPYFYKITIKDEGDADEVAKKVRENSGLPFRARKGVIFCRVDAKMQARHCALLESYGHKFISSPSIDKKDLERIAATNPVANEIAELKHCSSILSKILGSEYDRFIDDNGYIHADYSLTKDDESGAKSGRMSSSNPNAQQIPSKGKLFEDTPHEIKLGEVCRALFVPAHDNAWVVKADMSQCEYRLLAHYSCGEGSEKVKREFNENRHTDYHQFVVDLTGLSRKYAKNLNFGLLYGMGSGGMQEAFGWTKEHCDELREKYFSKMPFVPTTVQHIGDVCLKRAEGKKYRNGRCVYCIKGSGYIRSIAGRKLRMETANDTFKMPNRLMQGGNADVTKRALYLADKEGLFEVLGYNLVLVHDEITYTCPKTVEGVKAMLRLEEIMEGCFASKLSVPLLAEPSLGKDWGNQRIEVLLNDDNSHKIVLDEEKVIADNLTTAEEVFEVLNAQTL